MLESLPPGLILGKSGGKGFIKLSYSSGNVSTRGSSRTFAEVCKMDPEKN